MSLNKTFFHDRIFISFEWLKLGEKLIVNEPSVSTMDRQILWHNGADLRYVTPAAQ